MSASNKQALGTQTRVAEIIVEGETGFIVEDIDRAVEAVGKIEQISRARCRREFEQRFTDRHMAEDYIRIYQQLLSRSSTQRQPRVAGANWPIRSRETER